MSERGSFVTQYIYCEKCFEAAKTVLLGNDKYLCSLVIPSYEGSGKFLPIIAGKIGGLYAGEEIHTFLEELIPRLEPLLCKDHAVKIVVIPDNGEAKGIIAKSRKREDG